VKPEDPPDSLTSIAIARSCLENCARIIFAPIRGKNYSLERLSSLYSVLLPYQQQANFSKKARLLSWVKLLIVLKTVSSAIANPGIAGNAFAKQITLSIQTPSDEILANFEDNLLASKR
jgi:hypothetical protein